MQIDICPDTLDAASRADIMVDGKRVGWISSKFIGSVFWYHALFEFAPGLNTTWVGGVGQTRGAALLNALDSGSRSYRRKLELLDEMKRVVINKIGEE